jgi:hypothetical protein
MLTRAGGTSRPKLVDDVVGVEANDGEGAMKVEAQRQSLSSGLFEENSTTTRRLSDLL